MGHIVVATMSNCWIYITMQKYLIASHLKLFKKWFRPAKWLYQPSCPLFFQVSYQKECINKTQLANCNNSHLNAFKRSLSLPKWLHPSRVRSSLYKISYWTYYNHTIHDEHWLAGSEGSPSITPQERFGCTEQKAIYHAGNLNRSPITLEPLLKF